VRTWRGLAVKLDWEKSPPRSWHNEASANKILLPRRADDRLYVSEHFERDFVLLEMTMEIICRERFERSYAMHMVYSLHTF
jgi:hypothetical protein